MIVHDLDIAWTFSTMWPFETKPPLLIDPYAELSSPIAAQRFEPVRRQGTQIGETRRGIQDFQPLIGLLGETLELADKLALRKSSSSLVAIAQDHKLWSSNIYAVRQSYNYSAEAAAMIAKPPIEALLRWRAKWLGIDRAIALKQRQRIEGRELGFGHQKYLECKFLIASKALTR